MTLKTKFLFGTLLGLTGVVMWWRSSSLTTTPVSPLSEIPSKKIQGTENPSDQRTPATGTDDPEQVLMERLRNALPSAVAQSREAKAIQETALPNIRSLLNESTFDRTELVEAALKAQEALVTCLIENQCGQQKQGGQVYFDPSRTPAHRFLERSLTLLKAASEESSSPFERYVVKDHIATSRIPSPEIQKISLGILKNHRMSGSESIALINAAPALVDDAPAYFFVEFQKTYPPHSPLRTPFLAAAAATLAGDGSESKYLLDQLNKLDLSGDEFTTLTRAACPLLNDPIKSPRTRHSLSQYAEVRGYLFAPEHDCLPPSTPSS